jgi:hypothetical protein
MNATEAQTAVEQGSIIEQILAGQIDINSVEEFENLLDVFPGDPDLYRKFADMLAERKHVQAALVAYNKAAMLYLGRGHGSAIHCSQDSGVEHRQTVPSGRT